MNKKPILIASVVILFCAFFTLRIAVSIPSLSDIKRLTYSGSDKVQYPCLSDDGQWMLYMTEIEEGEETIRTIRILRIADGKERELYRDGKTNAPEPYRGVPINVGTKPPVLSGDGQVAIFSLSLAKPVNIIDHYLAFVSADGSDFRIIPFPIKALKGKDLKSLGFASGHWERLSNYALSEKGDRISCVVKGHLGPVRYGNPSGLILIDALIQEQRTVLSPEFNGKEWEWLSKPQRPLTGGGWAFGMSGNGEKILFGAQSSTDENDYDLYTVDWNGTEIKKITDFHDRWFSHADLNHSGDKVVFFYNGRKKQGMGTYSINSDGTELKYLQSQEAPRVELIDVSGDGKYILYKNVYKGMMMDLHTGRETVAYDEETPGYIKGIIPMDFPRIPAFWSPKIMSFKGDRILLAGPPQGKESPEIYLLSIEPGLKR